MAHGSCLVVSCLGTVTHKGNESQQYLSRQFFICMAIHVSSADVLGRAWTAWVSIPPANNPIRRPYF